MSTGFVTRTRNYYTHVTDKRLFSGDDENGKKIGDDLIFQISKSKRILETVNRTFMDT